MENEICNKGLDLAMEFGENWLQPVQLRLSERFKSLSKEQLDSYNEICTKAMNDGHKFIYDRLDKLATAEKKITNAQLTIEFRDYMTNKYVWINDRNLKHLFSQSLYYSGKEGLNNSITETTLASKIIVISMIIFVIFLILVASVSRG